jgi:hypothetical protein
MNRNARKENKRPGVPCENFVHLAIRSQLKKHELKALPVDAITKSGESVG